MVIIDLFNVIKRRLIFIAVFNLFALIFFTPIQAKENPNINIIFLDNFGFGEPGFNGGGLLRGAPTPRLDQIANEGLRLTNFNVEVQRTPFRSAILTGRYAIRSGNGNVPLGEGVYGLVQWEITMAEMLSNMSCSATIKFDFEYDGGGNGKGGTGTIYVDKKKVGSARIEQTQPNMFSSDKPADVGLDNQTPVALGVGYGPEETVYTGEIKQVLVEIR